MTAGTYNFVIEEGATFVRTLQFADGAAPLDLTGYTAKLQVRADYETPVLLELSTTNGRITIYGALGQVVWELTDEEAVALFWVQAIYDFFMTTPGGEAKKFLRGTVGFERRVTE